jgi:uncharacterized membrane protein
MLAHLYRGEMYRSKIWRTRLDATTNWAVATTGIALFVTASNASNSPLPLVLVALMSLVFLSIEGRRYRYFPERTARTWAGGMTGTTHSQCMAWLRFASRLSNCKWQWFPSRA